MKYSFSRDTPPIPLISLSSDIEHCSGNTRARSALVVRTAILVCLNPEVRDGYTGCGIETASPV